MKSGGFFNGITTSSFALAPYLPETLTDYEIGVKARLLDHRLSLEASAFWYDYRDLQTQTFTNVGAVSLIKLLGTKNRLLLNKLTRFTSSDPEERLVELLARVARTWRDDPYPADVKDTAPTARSVHLTHEQIGAMTALSRVSVTRALKSLADKGLVATGSKHVEILDREGLARLLNAGA